MTNAIREAMAVARLLLLRGGGVAATFLLNLLIVRRFGPMTNGQFQVALSYVMIAAAVARLGQEQLALRDVARLRAEDDAARARRTVDLSLLLTLPAGFLIAGGLALLATAAAANGADMVPAFAPVVLCLSGLWILTEALRGWQRVPEAIFWQGSFVPIAFVAAFVVLDGMGWLRPALLPLVYGVCALGGVAGAFWTWRRALPRLAGAAGSGNRIDLLRDGLHRLRQGSLFWMLAVLTNAIAWLDILVLNAVADARTVGIFQPIVRSGGLIAVGINIVTAGLIARLALLYAKGDGPEFLRAARLYWLAILAGSLLVGVLFIMFAKPIAGLWGPAIAPYHHELVVYVLIQLFQAVFIIAPLAAPVMGLERALLMVQVASVPLKAAAVVLGYAWGGLLGVILGIGLCTFVSVVWTVLLFLRQLQIMGLRWHSFITGRL